MFRYEVRYELLADAAAKSAIANTDPVDKRKVICHPWQQSHSSGHTVANAQHDPP